MTMKLTQWEQFDRLCQRYGVEPVVRSFTYLPRDHDRATLDKDGLARAHITDYNPKRCLEFVYSTGGIKRDGNQVNQGGWQMEKYRQNPMVLWSHIRMTEDPDMCLGRSVSEWVGRAAGGKALRGIIEFLPEGENAKADKVFRWYNSGFLNAVSASWKPLEFRAMTDEYIKETAGDYALSAKLYGGIEFIRNEFQEISPCLIPADPEALKKRIQMGEIRADEFTLEIPHEKVEEDGSKRGVFYLDSHEFVAESRTIVDMGSVKQQEAKATSVDTSAIDTLCGLIDGLRSDGFAIQSVSCALPKNDSFTPEFAAALAQRFSAYDFSSTMDSAQWVARPSETVRASAAGVTIPCGQFSIEYVRADVVASEGPVSFDIHGALRASEDDFNGLDARRRLNAWVAAGNNLRSAYAWGREGQYRLLHHDIVDGELVLNKSALYRCAQRLMQGATDIPAADIDAVRAHLAAEFAVLGVKAPWDQTLGRVYVDMHSRIPQAQGDELTALQRTAAQVARDLYGRYASREAWEQPQDVGVASETLAAVTRLLGRFVVDREVIEEATQTVLAAHLTAIRTLEEEFGQLRSLLLDEAQKRNIEIDFTQTDTLARLFAPKPAVESPEIQERVARLRNLLHSDSVSSTPSVNSRTNELYDAILKRLEDQPSRGSQGALPVEGNSKTNSTEE